jgi:hypothetical protein
LPAERPWGSPIAAIERFVFAPEDARRLAALRIGLFGLLAARLAINDYEVVADRPRVLFDPISVFELLPSMPSAELTSAVQAIGIAAALLAAAGAWPRASFPAAFAAALFLGLMLNAGGKVVHNDVVLMLCLLPLLATPRTASRIWALRLPGNDREWGAAQPRLSGPAYGWPIRTAMIVIALAYLLVGFQKLRYSGLDWITTDNLRWVLYASSDVQREPNQLALFVADRAWLAHLLAAGTIATELGFVLCLPFARLRWLFVPGVVALHLGIGLTMGLDYSAQALTVVRVFVNWVVVIESIRAMVVAWRHKPLRRAEGAP